MADDGDESGLRLEDAPGNSQAEAPQQPRATRADLFGEAESDAEDEAPPGSPTAQHPPADDEPPDEQPEAAEPQAEADAEPGAARQDDAEPAEPGRADGEEEQARGRRDDIFASDSEDEGGEGGAPRGYISEAEEEGEEDEFEALFKSKKRKRAQGTTQEIVMAVETLIANMEVAAEMDIAANEAGKPAVHKLKMLGAVEAKLAQSLLHRELLDSGILGALKLWLEPLPNGSLPNVKVRTAVLAMLGRLPIDLGLEGRKEQLKKSELGRYVMFYSRLPDETLANRQAARALVEKWSRPVFEQFRERQQDEQLQEREAELARLRKLRRQQQAAAAPPEPAKNLKPGDPGFRWHARMPEKARLDYLKPPESTVASDGGAAAAVKGRAKPKDKMSKKLAAMSRRGTGGGDGKVSLQGRGLLM